MTNRRRSGQIRRTRIAASRNGAALRMWYVKVPNKLRSQGKGTLTEVNGAICWHSDVMDKIKDCPQEILAAGRFVIDLARLCNGFMLRRDMASRINPFEIPP